MNEPWFPKVGHQMKTACLPRDIKLGWHPNDGKGTLLYGWDLTSDSLQLWEVVTTGKNGESKFVGFVKKEW